MKQNFKINTILYFGFLIAIIASTLWFNWNDFRSYSYDTKQNNLLMVSSVVSLLILYTVIFLLAVIANSNFEKSTRFGLILIISFIVFFLRSSNISIGLALSNVVDALNYLASGCDGNRDTWYCKLDVSLFGSYLPFVLGLFISIVYYVIVSWINKKLFKSQSSSKFESRWLIVAYSVLLLSSIELFGLTFQLRESLIMVSTIAFSSALFMVFISDSIDILPDKEKKDDNQSKPKQKESKDLPWAV